MLLVYAPTNRAREICFSGTVYISKFGLSKGLVWKGSTQSPHKINNKKAQQDMSLYKQPSCIYDHTCESVVRGVYPVMRKCRRGVGMREAVKPIRSLFM